MPPSDPTEVPAIPDKLYFRIGEVADLVGVEPHVLRYWEAEFHMTPHRSASGQRLYRKQDIVRFLHIQKLLHSEGFTIAGARKAMESGARSGAAGPAVSLDKLTDAARRIADLRRAIQDLRDQTRDIKRLP